MIVEQRADGKVETEATIKIWVDGERYVRTAEGNGPVHALDRALRAAIGRDPPAPQGHRARQLQGPHPRRDATAPTRSRASCSTRPTATDTWGSIGVNENVIAASWQALVDSLEFGDAAGPPAAAPEPARVRGLIPVAKPVLGAREEELVLEVLRSGLAVARARGCRRSSRRSPRGSAPRTPARSPAAPPACTSRCAPPAWGRATRSSPSPFSFVASANSVLFERARPVFADIDPVTLNLDPEAARGRGHRAHDGRCCRSTSSATRPTSPAFEALGLPIVEDACEALGAVLRRRHRRSAVAAAPGGLRLLRQQADDHRRGRDGRRPPTPRSRSASTPSATRAARRTWTGSTTTASASTTACPTSPARSASPSSSASTRCSPARARVAGWYREALAGVEGLGLPCEPRPATRPSGAAGSSSSSRCPRGARPRRGHPTRCASAGVQSKPYLPAIHLMSFYRERFGHREGEFPVCEDVAARSVALPFFPAADRGAGRARSPRRCAPSSAGRRSRPPLR